MIRYGVRRQGAARTSTNVDLPSRLRALLDDLRRHDSVLWRRAVDAGVTYGPDLLVRHSPALFGLVVGAVLPEQRRAVRRNLRLALGERGTLDEYRDVARVFINFASCLTDAFIAGSSRPDRLTGLCVNDEHFTNAFRRGLGVIVVTAHTGGWQAAAPLLRSVHAADVLIVMQRERDQRAQAIQDGTRDRVGVRMQHVADDPLAVLPLLAHLRRQGVVAIQIDRLPSGMRGRDVELFGRPWRVPEGPLQLAAASGAPIVPVFTRRTGFMEYEICIAPPISLPRKPGSSELDVAARQITAEMERFLRDNPTQWFHFE
ncbi:MULTISPECIES: lysophospholipid acyltransferase family protein [Sorangium]|uniref:Lysophospholipid acyltransferase family protein n=1 Tax=Sorangium atrum TaxID=2995308 RepID=A0ABT5BQZ4_9BACT|nr:lysophospholipid acyltransferase family protein [Sorangium aterium]MDC0676575.1 lysophospholipid acyltransferase family protein [Sorangium aterium]